VKAEGQANDLLDRLAGEKVFAGIDLQAVLDPSQFIGRAPQQVDQFIEQVVTPIRKRYADQLQYDPDLKV
jgi:adenylosuccinate lyase